MGTGARTALPASLSFLGGTGTVTGSRFLVERGADRVLVDCGLFQGLKELRARNRAPFSVEPDSIAGVAVTHAHLDHVGYLPALVRDGFGGSVIATPGTVALSRIVLPDSGRLQEEEASYAARKGYSKHHPPRPLYTEADARRALRRFRAVPAEEPTGLGPGMTARLQHAGHILGASQVALSLAGGPLLWFTGDLGRPNHPLLTPPAPLGDADVLVVESTYGDRRHEPPEVGVDLLADAVRRTDARGGVTVIPAFAVDRTELVLLQLRRLKADGRIPDLPIYVDSPMALAALDVYRAALRTDPFVRPEVAREPDPIDPGRLIELRSPQRSRWANRRARGVIIAASGMATGGRVLHHLAHRLPDSRNSVLLVGYQAPGTRGRALLDGAEHVKLLGQYVPVRAEIVVVPGFSVHADRDELLQWLGAARRAPGMTYVVHGELAAARSLRDAIAQELGWQAVVPRHGERVRLG